MPQKKRKIPQDHPTFYIVRFPKGINKPVKVAPEPILHTGDERPIYFGVNDIWETPDGKKWIPDVKRRLWTCGKETIRFLRNCRITR